MRPVYVKTQDTRLAGVERRLRFLERREQLPNPHLETDLGGGSTGIVFDEVNTGGWLYVSTPGTDSPNGDIILEAGSDIVLQIVDGSGGGLARITLDESTGGIELDSFGTGGITLDLNLGGGKLRVKHLPTTAPGSGGYVWNDGGTLKIT
jgi:hypothetical protein